MLRCLTLLSAQGGAARRLFTLKYCETADARTLIQVTVESVILTLEEILTDYLLLVFQSIMLA